MKFLYWLCGILFTLMASGSVVFFVLGLTTGEIVPQQRARSLYRWATVIALATFNLWVFKRVFDGLRALH